MIFNVRNSLFCSLTVLAFLAMASGAQAKGQRLFTDATYHPGTTPHKVAVADFNRDGIQDLAVTDGAGGEGLQSIDEDDDMLSAMARELVERNGIGESADAVWKALNAEHQKVFPTASEPVHEMASPDSSGNVLRSDSDACALVQEAP
jgi:hypothetical protein